MNPETKTPQRKIPLGRPVFDQKEVDAVSKIYERQWVLDGPEVRRFEEVFKTYIGSSGAASVSNCTTGMHLALIALGVKPGDEVLIPAFNFTADGLAILQTGARPVFVDIDAGSGNIDPRDLIKRITPKSKAILALHYAGIPCALNEVLDIAKKYNLSVIEDAAHALGAKYDGKQIGNHGDAVVFSFGPLKMICTGMGGMITFKNPALAERLSGLRSYGMSKSMWERQQSKTPWSYTVSELGHNFRMTDFQAATGIVQMGKLDAFIKIRKQLAARYTLGLSSFKFFVPLETLPNTDPVPLYYAIRIISGGTSELRDKVALGLIQKGIGASVHWDPPLHQHPLYAPYASKSAGYPASELLSREIISLPLSPLMTEGDVDYIVDHIREILAS